MRFGGHFDAMATNTKQDGVLVIFWVFVHTCAVVHPDHWLSFWVFVCRCVVVHPEHMPLKQNKRITYCHCRCRRRCRFRFCCQLPFRQREMRFGQ